MLNEGRDTMKFAYLFIVLFTLSACTAVVPKDNSADSGVNHEIKPSTVQVSTEYLAKNEEELSIQDSEMAYEMSVSALTDYYKAIWNGTSIELDRFMDNENLIKYTKKKIQSQYHVNAQFDTKVKEIKIGTRDISYTDDSDGGFLYLKLPVEIILTVGSRGEVTEFLVRNVNGKLVIADWYSGTKDGYDFTVRGENLTINNPDIWNEHVWAKKLIDN